MQANKEGKDEKIDKLQEAIEMLLTAIKGMMHLKPQKLEELLDEEDETPLIPKSKGVFRDPAHAGWERQKLEQQQLQSKYGDDDLEDRKETQILQHLKMSFPVYKEGSDTLEWLRDCERKILFLRWVIKGGQL